MTALIIAYVVIGVIHTLGDILDHVTSGGVGASWWRFLLWVAPMSIVYAVSWPLVMADHCLYQGYRSTQRYL